MRYSLFEFSTLSSARRFYNLATAFFRRVACSVLLTPGSLVGEWLTMPLGLCRLGPGGSGGGRLTAESEDPLQLRLDAAGKLKRIEPSPLLRQLGQPLRIGLPGRPDLLPRGRGRFVTSP